MIDALFVGLSAIAFGGWIILICLPEWEAGRRWIAGFLIPVILSVAYLVLFPVLYFQAPGGFGSIGDLVQLLTFHPGIVLAAWLHYLAFDLLIGCAILEESRLLRISHLMMIVPLVLCFMFGPVGWLSYIAIKRIRSGAL